MVECSDEFVVAFLGECVFVFLYKKNKDDCDVDFLHAHPSEYILEETLDEKFLVHDGYMQKIVWYETYVHLCYHHNYKNQMIIMIT